MAFSGKQKQKQTSLDEARKVLLAQRDELAAQRRELDERASALEAREAELELRAEHLATAELPTESTATLARVESRIAELHEAEKSFLRTRDELAARSEAVAARERLVAQREREIADRDEGTSGPTQPELTELEARLRRLEQREQAEETLGFSGGLRNLERGTRLPRRD